MSGNSEVNQKGAVAGGDMVGRDKYVFEAAPAKLSKLEKLKERLQQEIADDAKCHQTIDELLHFQKKVPEDGVVGLEAKLEVAGRSHQLMSALEMKERFAKLLERWSLYSSAQEIFAHLLAMADYKFGHQIRPLVGKLGHIEIDELIEQKIILPAIEDTGVEVFSLDHHTAMGMMYWLAEQCRVRWHA